MHLIWLIISLAMVESNPSELLNNMLAKYDKRVRPFTDEKKPVTVQMTIVLGILTELQENNQVASFVISHVQRWVDPKLSWNPEENGGLEQLVIPLSFIWTPKIFIYNSMNTREMLPDSKNDARVHYTGHIKVNMPLYVTCICRLSIERFPFDSQFCAIAQASPLLTIEEMNVNATQPPNDSYFAGNAEWEVLNVTVRGLKFMEEGEYRIEVHYIVHLHRSIVAPTFLISALSILGIFSPGENDGPRGEKVSLGLGSLLAMVVLLDIVATAMPKSNSIPLLGYFIISMILINAFGVAINMTLLGISRKLIETEKMPSPFAYSAVFMRSPKRQIDYWEAGSNNLDYFEGMTINPPKFPDLIALFNRVQEIAIAQNAFKKRIEKAKWIAAVEKEWNKIFSRYDYFMLFIFEMLNLVVLLLFLRVSWLPLPELPDDFSV